MKISGSTRYQTALSFSCRSVLKFYFIGLVLTAADMYHGFTVYPTSCIHVPSSSGYRPILGQTPTPILGQTPTPILGQMPTPILGQTPTPILGQTPTPILGVQRLATGTFHWGERPLLQALLHTECMMATAYSLVENLESVVVQKRCI